MLSNAKIKGLTNSVQNIDKTTNETTNSDVSHVFYNNKMEHPFNQLMEDSRRTKVRHEFNNDSQLARNNGKQQRSGLQSRNRQPRATSRSSEYDENIIATSIYSGKYQETLNRYNSNESVNLTSNSDMRISKLLRRLCAENNPTNAIDLCEKLKTVICDQSNTNYIRKAFDFLAESIISIFKTGPTECLEHVAEIFGMMGFVVRNDFQLFLNYVKRTYKTQKNLQSYMMVSVLKMLILDKKTLAIREQSDRLMELLKDYLEAVDIPDLFITIIEVVEQLCKNYPTSVEPHFTDIVDIVVGWHLEPEQTAQVKQHCSRILQEFKSFWEKDIKFTLSLLGQFLEDITSCGDELQGINNENSTPSVSSPEKCYGSFVGTFNTVIKCLYSSPEILVFFIGKDLLLDSFEKILSVGMIALNLSQDDEIILSLNEYLILILNCRRCGSGGGNGDGIDLSFNYENLYSIIKLQIEKIENFTDEQILSLLIAILKIINEFKTQLSIDFVNDLLSKKSNLLKIRFTKNQQIQKSLIKIYQELLNLKNVELLQVTYKHILIDLYVALKTLPSTEHILWNFDDIKNVNDTDVNDDNTTTTIKYNERQAEFLINFYLSGLSKLATTNSSIIAMWALQPSILSLLACNLHPTDKSIWIKYSSIHYSIINLLLSHCCNNNNFIGSSKLLKGKNSLTITNTYNIDITTSTSTTLSPTSDNFEIILEFLAKIFQLNLYDEHLILLIDYCNNLLQQLIPNSLILKDNHNFNQLICNLNKLTIKSCDSIQIKCSDCIKIIQQYENIHPDILISIAEISCVQMCSTNAEIRERYSYILSKVPLKYSLQQVNTFTGGNREQSQLIKGLEYWHISTVTHSDLRPKYFKDFIQKLSFNRDDEDLIEDFLKEIFTNCWYLDDRKSNEFGRYAYRDVRLLINWIQWEAAQYCVNNKLRTPLGKPQDTFLKIESIIKDNARVLALKEKMLCPKTVKNIIAKQKNARILLGFLESLEKVIYNASEGTAFSMPQPEKPARTFFRINAPTCHEWFNRIRTAVDLVALHCMEPEMVIRYTEVVLKNLVSSGKTNELLFEHTVMSLSWGLFRNGESDALFGLYAWCKTVADRKILWIKMIAEQSAGRREIAADGYINILETQEELLDPIVRDFIIDQLTLCLLFVKRWQELKILLEKEENRSQKRSTIPMITLTSKQIDTMIQYEETKMNTFLNLSDWETLETKPYSNSDSLNNFSCHQLMSLTENTLGKMLIARDEPYNETIVKQCFTILHQFMQECLRTKSMEHLNHLTILNHICHKVKETKLNKNTETMMSLTDIDKIYGSITLYRTLAWSEYFHDNLQQQQQQLDNSNVEQQQQQQQQTINIRLDMAAIARKESNFNFCKGELNNFFNKSDYARKNNLSGRLTVDTIKEQFTQTSVIMDPTIWNENMSRGVYETCKLLYCFPHEKYNSIQLASSMSTGIIQRLNGGCVETPYLRERAARILLTLSEWLQLENEKIITENQNSSLVRLLVSLPDIKPYPEDFTPSLVPIIESSVGKLINYSVKQCPDLAKAWGALGTWCYRWGRKMVEIRNEDNDKAGLRICDVSAITNIITNATNDDIQKIVAILNQHQVTAEEEDIDPNVTSSTEMIENQLRTLPILTLYSQEHLHSIIEIWRQAHKTVYGYYEMAADAYFKYLQLATINDEQDSDNNHENCSIVTATLRLLRLVVKHALGLQEVLEEGLATTPTSPWKAIIPQLFSRMNHHELYVRRRVSELLCRVANDAPHLIIFPTVVGAVQGQKTDLGDISMVTNDDLDDVDTTAETNDGTVVTTETDEHNEINSGLIYCFNSLLDTLSKEAAETVNQVQLLVRELKRITLLWDELWLVTLAQIYSEWLKRFVSFENYIKKFKDRDGSLTTTSGGGSGSSTIDKNIIIAGKYNIMMKPVIFVMERLNEMTSRKPETNNEILFQERFKSVIEETIDDLKKPFNSEKPHDTWCKFKELYRLLQQKSQRKSSSTLKMIDISPVLAQLKDTVISMPGIETSGGEPVYIKSVDNIVHILPTKTKPKKLVFYGSNGKRYTYLFKGLEDLHLDERIMQFLSIANTMITKSTDCNGNISKYRARHYSVIPLGPRSGLISWVDGVIPIFALYKKWQQREVTNPKKDKQSTVIMRPSELFYSKLHPLLLERGIKKDSNRKEWPQSVMRQVLVDLSTETPRDLLAKELWCNSTTAAGWRQVIRNYSRSIAVMSVIGYVIGLGDRHLDNVLIELSSGEIVHIDYNVCFEKGKTLRVPEKVPFRMTPNLEEALGVTGIEGTFRLACEHVLKALKKGRETLLTLLEAFVYDPLVDWAVGEDGGAAGDLAVSAYGGEALGGELRQARKQLEREVTRDTIAIRFTEIKTDWIQNRDEIHNQLNLMQTNLIELTRQRDELIKTEVQRDLLSKQLALIHEVESLGSALGSHPLNTISQRYGVYKRTNDEFRFAKNELIKKSDDCDKQMDSYNMCIEDIKTNKFIEYIDELQQIVDVQSEFDVIKDFLENSAQTQMYQQCDQTRKELDSSSTQLALIVKQSFDTLIQYGTIIKFCPKSYHNNHRFVRFSQWCQYLVEQKTVQSCRDVVLQYNNLLGEGIIKPTNQQIIQFTLQMQTMLHDINCKLQNTYERIHSEFDQPDLILPKQKYVQLHDEIMNNIKLFLQQELNSIKSLEYILLQSIVNITKRYQMIENSSSCVGENLLDYTSNGKWFLNDLCAHSTILTEFTTLIYQHNQITTNDLNLQKNLTQAFNCFKTTNSVYLSLNEMNYNFLTSVLPDIVQGIISEDKSVLDMISAVSNIQDGIISLSDLQINLNQHLRCTIMNVQQSSSTSMANTTDTLRIVNELKEKLFNFEEKLMKINENNNNNNSGWKLFMAFTNLFVNVETKHYELVKTIEALNVSGEWMKKLDNIKDAKDLATLMFNPATRAVLEDIFIVKRLDVMIEVFTLCLQMACTFKGSGLTLMYDDERLNRPIKKYIADYVLRLLLGVGPYSLNLIICNLLQRSGTNIEQEINLNDIGAQNKISLDDLCKKGIKFAMKNGNFTTNVLSHASLLCNNLELTLRKRETIQYQQELLQCQTTAMKRIQLLMTAYNWINEDFIANQSGIGTRSYLLAQLKTLIQKLSAWKVTIQKIRDGLIGFVTTAVQRLKWAVGANPTLIGVLTEFESLTTIKREQLDKRCLLAAVALKSCISVLNYETLRLKMPETLENDQTFLNLISRWEKSCMMSQSLSNAVNPIEEALVELLDPEGPIDLVWLNDVAALIDNMTEQTQNEIVNYEKEISESQDNLQKCGHKLRSLIFYHHRMASDVIVLLKTTLKIDGEHNGPTRDYLQRYKQFLDTITELHGTILSKDFTKQIVEEIMLQISELLENVHGVYDDLFWFENDMKESKESDEKKLGNKAATDPTKKIKANQTEQKRNAYAVSVWRRIRMKLEGRDPDPTKRCTIQEQVDWMIREAMNPDNLAVLYEGWTPWI